MLRFISKRIHIDKQIKIDNTPINSNNLNNNLLLFILFDINLKKK